MGENSFDTRINARDVGYIIALLRALYSKEEFDNWVLASGYGLRKDGGASDHDVIGPKNCPHRHP